MSAYVRSVGNPMLAKKNYKGFYTLLTKSSLYFFVTLAIIGFGIFIFSQQIAALFFTDFKTISLLSNCFQRMAIFYISEGFMVKLNSELRMLGFEGYVFWVAFCLFVCFFPPSLFYCTWKLGAGALTAIALIGFSNCSVSGLFIFRLIKDFKKNVQLQFERIETENQNFLIDKQQIELI